MRAGIVDMSAIIIRALLGISSGRAIMPKQRLCSWQHMPATYLHRHASTQAGGIENVVGIKVCNSCQKNVGAKSINHH